MEEINQHIITECIQNLSNNLEILNQELFGNPLDEQEREILDNLLKVAVKIAESGPNYQKILHNHAVSDPIIGLMINRNCDENLNNECLKYIYALTSNDNTAPKLGKSHDLLEAMIKMIKTAAKAKEE